MDANSQNVENMDLNKISEAMSKVNVSAGKEAEETLKMLFKQALAKGILPKEVLRISDDMLEGIYAQAYNLYNQGKYKEASYIFRLLMLLDFTMHKYTLGLAACLHRMKDYVNASNIYLLCASLDAKNPMAHYHAADCYLQLGAIDLAIVSLEMAITAAGDQPQYAVVKERATLLRNGLKAQKEKEKGEGKKEGEKEKTAA